jgi:nucleoside 2-deoxyribosyltransferase
MSDPCEVCELEKQHTTIEPSGDIRYRCGHCGTYDLPPRTHRPEGRSDRKVQMAGFIRSQNDAQIIPRLTDDTVREVARMPIPRLRERVNRALVFLARSSPAGQARANPGDPELLARTYCASETEFRNLIFEHLVDEGMLQRAEAAGKMVLSPKGYLAADDLEYQKVNSAQGFVAMSFDPKMNSAWTDGFYRGIEAAGYYPLRMDHKEHINGISDEIMSEIRRSKFVVADYTDQNNGVYFEAGFALGLGIPVIPTCREGQVKRLHFDIRHINTLKWKNPEQLRDDLARRISAVI